MDDDDRGLGGPVSFTPPNSYRAAAPHAESTSEGIRLRRLIWILILLTSLLLLPSLVQRVQYANTFAKEKAKLDVATEGLEKFDGEQALQALALASRWVANKVAPSVVHIQTVRHVNGRQAALAADDSLQFFGDPRQEYEARGQGSGVVVDEAGFVITNHHVIAGATEITVQLSDGRRLAAKLRGSDPLTDMAVLEIPSGNLVAAEWGKSDDLETGDLVWAIGSPFGLDRTVTFGIVSATGRRNLTSSPYTDFLQTDAAVNPGNSGGPLVNIRGELVGINTAIVGNSYQGISFAIPSAIAYDVFNRLKSDRKVARGWLGVSLKELPPELAAELGSRAAGGVLVAPYIEDGRGNIVSPGVLPNSPADRAGIKPGDVILAWNGAAAMNPTTLSRLVAATKVNSKAKAKVLRGEQVLELDVLVEERPPEPGRD